MTPEEKIKAIDEIRRKYNIPLTNLTPIEENDFLNKIITKPLFLIVNEYVPIINCYREIMRIMYDIQELNSEPPKLTDEQTKQLEMARKGLESIFKLVKHD